jgi:tetratricopeptide (TPR) repeat protein
VRDLAGAPKAAAPLVLEILAYYRALARHTVIEQDDVAALLRLAADDAPPKEHRIAALDAIPDLVTSLDLKTKRLLDPLLNHADDQLREGAQICLALLGDRTARRDVIKRYNDLVAQNEAWAGAYEQRAAVLLKLREYVDAAKDYRRAIKVYTDMKRTENLDALYVDLARTYARDGSPKRAYDALVEGNLPTGVLRKLKGDPDFAELAAHSRYGKILDV